ncbi:MAG TPA: hypothetical protein DGD08_05035 [Gemmatimonas aurantiaca]|uniref:DUF3192 domain-containing protein n=2 Tax=Gemmatimonas aurantiaca TaxID=173480 RepID=C1A6C4_GEMAT|nr:hypothetical protein [Gemmatimonas aurantiaca]BAH37784.1 hypothetical protein GAU_0742 [Gemmatimonas aurantiaca T-27]HCT56562.1 hypothetical protein [Gemmatimonas aurantiaca]
MKTAFVRSFAVITVVGTFSVLAACGPSDLVGKEKLGSVKEGMTFAQVDSVIGKGPLDPMQPGDSLRLHNGFRTQIFLIQGQQYTVVWYRDTPGSIEDGISRQTETPLLFQGNMVLAKGWSDFDAKAEELNIPNPYRAKERLDSISESQTKR